MLEQVSLPFHVVSSVSMPMPRGPLLAALLYVRRTSKNTANLLIDMAVRIATLPYYRLYHFNTIDPLKNIATLASESPPNAKTLQRAVSSWRSRKLGELQFITISCTVLAAAVIGAFSWTTIENAYWLTHAFWHSSLILAILCILLSASEITVLHLLGPLQSISQSFRDANTVERYKPLLLSFGTDNIPKYVPRKKMVVTWQGPLMFMSYSVCTFLAGLTILVCTPFIRHGRNWTTGHNIATMYLMVLAGGLTAFVFCSFWVYYYVDLGLDVNSDDGGHVEDPESVDFMGLREMLFFKISLNFSFFSAAFSV
ncbi:uncharacterized protein K460DRAFT_382724 [Cucurbitaria berberidis CBS 394.84]|uniref:Uncharacterized protein n=1 Tax=Cucurbitaria berberidis CBS 394.84 TaxID=1168544 RepID=A0A9P4LDQ5_9PLEO|nr:uncharacterized protein K460DRAFT_382724 [Cucurbitaria berberidis CBS 394.84]KAF1851255.1 hypothetical protein K460DRAFT_382724 [Cucurbitaria berberidis CBS 394.84]